MDEQQNTSGSKGSLVGAIIVVIVLIIGAFYLIKGGNNVPTPTGEENATTTSEVNDVSDLQAEADNLDVSVDADLADLEDAINQ